MTARLACLAVLFLFPHLALADELGKPPPTCTPKSWNEVEAWRDWISHTRPDNTANWAEEAPRMANERGVWRWLDRLFIVVEGGKVTTLADCPFSDGMYYYVYERYDEAGRFHVVRTQFYEDHVFALVMTKTGRLIDIPGRPIWSPDKARFAYGVCDLLNGKDNLAIMRPTAKGVKAEIETTIPCGLGDCELAWENGDALTATCPRSGDEGNEPKRVRYVRRGEEWVATTTALLAR